MSECFICGISGEKVRLYDAISKEGIEKICYECSVKENIPIIKKPTTFQLKEAETRPVNYSQYRKTKQQIIKEEEKKELDKQNASLRDLVNKNYVSKIPKMENLQIELIDNFHWAIMRKRRQKHITQKQLAEAIGEAEAAIRMAERGILPQDDYRLINKLENYLKIRLRRNPEKLLSPVQLENSPARVLDFKPEVLNELTIADLKRIKEEKESQNKRNKMQKLMDNVRKTIMGKETSDDKGDEETFINED
jgi:ribosome-binding protein aMBF1 (putative translation factor)